jgi:hypothetical protein
MMINNFNGKIANDEILQGESKILKEYMSKHKHGKNIQLKEKFTAVYDFNFDKPHEFFSVTGSVNDVVDYMDLKIGAVDTYTDLSDPTTSDCVNNVLDRLFNKTTSLDDKTLKCD